jgi:hypothetical protein
VDDGRSAGEQLQVACRGQPGRHALAGRARAGAGDEPGVREAAGRELVAAEAAVDEQVGLCELTSISALPPATARRIARSRLVRLVSSDRPRPGFDVHGAHRRQRRRGAARTSGGPGTAP